jgi:hypothetical protein
MLRIPYMEPREPSSIDYDELRRFVPPGAHHPRRAPQRRRPSLIARALELLHHAMRRFRTRAAR